jgi:hypothetical protein
MKNLALKWLFDKAVATSEQSECNENIYRMLTIYRCFTSPYQLKYITSQTLLFERYKIARASQKITYFTKPDIEGT